MTQKNFIKIIKPFLTLKIIYLLIFLFISLNTFSKDKLEQYLDKYKDIQSFKADIVQKKKLKVMKNSQLSYGSIYFKKPKKLLWKLEKPFEYKFLLNGNKIVKEYPQLNEVQTILIDKDNKLKVLFDNIFIIMGLANYNKIKEKYIVKLHSNTITLIPKEEKFKKIIKHIEIHLNNESIIKTLIILETNENQTEIHFSNVKLNLNLSEKLFK